VTSSISTLTTNPAVLANIQGNIKSLYLLRVVIVEIAKRYTLHAVGENLFIWLPKYVSIKLLTYLICQGWHKLLPFLFSFFTMIAFYLYYHTEFPGFTVFFSMKIEFCKITKIFSIQHTYCFLFTYDFIPWCPYSIVYYLVVSWTS
jgi:hypothetical protein